MDRRHFIRKSVPVTLAPFLLHGLPIRAFGRSALLDALSLSAANTDHVLVLIQLNGGNDGLNMVIPIDQYDGLMALRRNIAIAESRVLPLTPKTGLHPAMTALKGLFDDGKVAVVQSVGYPNPNFSHFRATDIWLTGSDSEDYVTTGWMGRYLDSEFPGFPEGYPNEQHPDPLAIQIGSTVSPGLQGRNVPMGMAITSATSFLQLVTGGVDVAPDTRAGHELTFVRHVVQQSQQYGIRVREAAGRAPNKSSLYPQQGQNSLADQLKIVASLIAGGLQSRIYVVSLGGFDTHSSQVSSTADSHTGAHANLLGRLSTAIAAFQDDIRLLGVERRVIGMTFSEFGRRIKSNASLGTDHGAAAPVIMFGNAIVPGVVGSNPVISQTQTNNDNIPMQVDFRSIYASILRNWFQVPPEALPELLLRQFDPLPIITPGGRPGEIDYVMRPFRLEQNYPNPFNASTDIRFYSSGGHVTLRVYDALGKEVATLVDGEVPAGDNTVRFDAGALASGVYYYRIGAGPSVQMKRMMLVK